MVMKDTLVVEQFVVAAFYDRIAVACAGEYRIAVEQLGDLWHECRN